MSIEPADHYYRSADGLRLYCGVYPAARPGGLPVLCLPGLTRNSRDFRSLAARLCERHEVLSADLRGRGRSAWDPNPANYQPATYVGDAWSLLASRGIQRAVVIGTSLGALVAMIMAASKPQAIAGVVLNDAGPELDPAGLKRIAGYAGKLSPVSTWAQAAAQARQVYGDALPGLSDAQWLDYARRGYREDAAGVPVPDVDPMIAAAFNTVGTAANVGTAAPDLWPLFALLKPVPMLVIRGALSDLLAAATVARMQREKPDLQQVTVANRGHAPLLDEPECLGAIDAFLASTDRGG